MSPSHASRNYALFTTSGETSLLNWRMKDEGIAIEGDRLRWWTEHGERRQPVSDIREIRLAVKPSGRGTTGGLCEVTFRNFERVAVHSTTAWGNHDEHRLVEYRAFVQALHAALPEETRKRASFYAGARGGSSPWVRAVGIGLVAVVGLAIVLVAFNVSGLKAIWLPVLAATVLLWPLLQQLRANTGEGGYGPDRIPPELLP